MKIFKYRIEEGKAIFPENAQILRIDHVDDGFYNGDFLWAIVDPEWDCIQQDVEMPLEEDKIYPKALRSIQFNRSILAVKEKQEISLPSKPIYASDLDGFLWVFYEDNKNVAENYEIACFKTGQEIDLPVESLEYLGLCRLWIMQELALYCFLVKE